MSLSEINNFVVTGSFAVDISGFAVILCFERDLRVIEQHFLPILRTLKQLYTIIAE